MDGKLLMPGGRLTSTVGALTSSVYFLDPVEGIQGKVLDLGNAFFRSADLFNDTRIATFYADPFASMAGWTDAAGAWAIVGGAAEGVAATTGWAISNTDPTLKEERALVDVSMSSSGALPDFVLACRATFAANAITDGYVVRYTDDGATKTWNLERYNASVPTVVATQVDVSGSPTLQFTAASFRTLELRVEESGPVHITATFNGSTLFDAYDFDSGRISSIGKIGFYGGGS